MTEVHVGDWGSVDALRGAGFTGFKTVAELMADPTPLPQTRGVYVLLRDRIDAPELLPVGTGGFFKGKDPNVAVDVLRLNWVLSTPVVYIGKAGDPGRAATLRTRLKQYLAFGAGRNVGHWGGRYVWQLADAQDLRFAWLELPDGHPSEVESKLIESFRGQFGSRPFANLTK